MNNFKEQIDEDIKEFQQKYSYITNIEKPEWAFNFWVLNKLFFVDEEIIENQIVDYHDLGIDCYEIYEDTKEVYLIQNKYFSENTSLLSEYVKNDFLIRAISALENGTYPKSEELQTFFTKYKDDEDFIVHFQLFMTNNKKNTEVEEYLKKFNKLKADKKYIAEIFYLDDIQERFFSEVKTQKKYLDVKINSINKGTILQLNTEAYKLENVLDARYVLTPVSTIYSIMQKAKNEEYPIFDKNIREYLGNKKINLGIYRTLQDPLERNNFFYYNNGVTIICDDFTTIETSPLVDSKCQASFTIKNPQIVNGCQTVNSIYEALKIEKEETIIEDYKSSYVMVKILKVDRDDESQKDLYKNIVRYNNSQNAIDEKNFVANTELFKRFQTEFENKGFLLLIKQSDKVSFAKKYESCSKLKSAANERLSKFGFDSFKKTSDFYIELEKLLQVVCAFKLGAQTAYLKKSEVLKLNTTTYEEVTSFLKNITTDVILDLYLFYLKAEKARKQSEDKRTPIPYYVIDCFAKFECNERNVTLISDNLPNAVKINTLITLYEGVTKMYSNMCLKDKNVDYNKMIKQKPDYGLLEVHRDGAKQFMK